MTVKINTDIWNHTLIKDPVISTMGMPFPDMERPVKSPVASPDDKEVPPPDFECSITSNRMRMYEKITWSSVKRVWYIIKTYGTQMAGPQYLYQIDRDKMARARLRTIAK